MKNSSRETFKTNSWNWPQKNIILRFLCVYTGGIWLFTSDLFSQSHIIYFDQISLFKTLLTNGLFRRLNHNLRLNFGVFGPVTVTSPLPHRYFIVTSSLPKLTCVLGFIIFWNACYCALLSVIKRYKAYQS